MLVIGWLAGLLFPIEARFSVEFRFPIELLILSNLSSSSNPSLPPPSRPTEAEL